LLVMNVTGKEVLWEHPFLLPRDSITESRTNGGFRSDKS
jgi:hypothetical protein